MSGQPERVSESQQPTAPSSTSRSPIAGHRNRYERTLPRSVIATGCAQPTAQCRRSVGGEAADRVTHNRPLATGRVPPRNGRSAERSGGPTPHRDDRRWSPQRLAGGTLAGCFRPGRGTHDVYPGESGLKGPAQCPVGFAVQSELSPPADKRRPQGYGLRATGVARSCGIPSFSQPW